VRLGTEADGPQGSPFMPAYTQDAVVVVHPFSRQAEGDDVIIGRVETGVFLAVPPGAVEILDYLREGRSVGEAAELYRQQHGAVPDLDDFLQILEVKGIIETAGAEGKQEAAILSQPRQQQRRIRYHFENFPEPLARHLFSRPVLSGCLILMAVALGAYIHDPAILPRLSDLYVSDHRTLIWSVLLLVSYGSVALHELSHVVAARAIGVSSRLGFGNRLWDLVVEADLTGLWSVPKRKRYLPLFAGSLLDAVSASVCFLILYAHGHHWLTVGSVPLRIIKLALLTYLTRVMWQGFLFVRTDYYYVISTMFNCRNLLSDTEAFLRNQLARILPWVRKVDQTGIPASERKVIPIYAIVWVGGRIVALTWLFSVTIPLARKYIGNLGHALMNGFSRNPGNFVDSLLLVAIFILPIAIGSVLWMVGLVRGAIKSIALPQRS
jgi:putative peptide zinc metalloprotease protein